MHSDLLKIFGALERAGVRYLVVGGVAVVLHGHLRFTGDVDLVLRLEPDNARAGMRALHDLGFRPRAPVNLFDFADTTTRESWVRDKALAVFSLWSRTFPGTEIDVFVEEPFDFEAAWARKSTFTFPESVVGGEPVRATVVSIQDLISMKKAAGRPKDLEDVAELELIALQLKGSR